jgi:hypothetical protein
VRRPLPDLPTLFADHVPAPMQALPPPAHSTGAGDAVDGAHSISTCRNSRAYCAQASVNAMAWSRGTSPVYPSSRAALVLVTRAGLGPVGQVLARCIGGRSVDDGRVRAKAAAHRLLKGRRVVPRAAGESCR